MMFPGVDRDVIVALLAANGNKMQRTIDSLLQVTLDQPISSPVTAPEQTNLTPFEPSKTTSPTTISESNTTKPDQLIDDEIFARSLQAQWSQNENPDDEVLAAEMARMEKDEMLARQLQRREMQSVEAVTAAALYNRRRSGPHTWPDSDSNSTDSDQEPGEPITTQIDKKLTEIGQDIKSGWTSFTSKISEAFASPAASTPSATEPAPAPAHAPPASQAVYSPLFETDQDEKDLLSSDDEGHEHPDDNSLIDKRKERKTGNVELTINTE